MVSLNFRGALLQGSPNSPGSQREAVLHLVHPDTFEGTTYIDDKRTIADAEAYARFVTEQTSDVDRKLAQIRRGLEVELGRGFDFYDADIYPQKPSPAGPWDELVTRAKAFIDTGRLESQENNYKLEIGRKLAIAREAVLAGDDTWADLLRRGLASVPGYPMDWRLADAVNKWVDDSRNEAMRSLQAIWTRNNLTVSERIGAFINLLTPLVIRGGVGTRTNVASVLLMGLDVEQYPPFRISLFNKAYESTGYDKPEYRADEAALYSHALGFLDRFIHEAEQRGLQLRHRLDAQSVMWAILDDVETIIENGEGSHPPRPGPDLQTVANDVYLPVEFLEEIDKLLKDKRQVIFQGPPGTGKTYVAQVLARCLAGSDARVKLVQFHPSYAYEDFVQGFRPALVDGQPVFNLTEGPLLRAAKQARNEPDSDHFLVIDEINRGNLAKVFGELYFLLEYRDQKMDLQYSDDPFSLPENLYIIGTMNTADRSIALVDLALRRRFYFVEFHPDDEPVKSVLRKWLKANAPGIEWVAGVVERVNERLSNDRHAAIGPSYFIQNGLDEAMVERTWKHSIIPYVEERRFGGGEKSEDFSLHKLRRKASSDGAQAEDKEIGDDALGVDDREHSDGGHDAQG